MTTTLPGSARTLPGPTLGVVGGGQLGRMIGEAAAPLGVDVVVLDPTPEPPAAPTTCDWIAGDFDDPDAVRELAARADVLTYEIELADPDLLAAVSGEYDVPVHPDPETLRTISDKFVQKSALAEAGIPVPEFVAVDDADGLASAVDRFDGVMVKAREGGYDGRGNVPAEPGDDPGSKLREVLGGDGGADGEDPTADGFEGAAMAERLVPFEREIAVMGVKGADDVRTYPVTETVHREEILRESVTPARTDGAVLERAESVARDVLEWLDGRGVFGIELFETADGEVLVNEIAPRPHNSGHWTIEGAHTSQFENHVRAVLGWPLGPATLDAPAVTANLLGDVDEPEPATLSGVESVLAAPDADLHWYGKREARPLRKMGHLTVTEREADPEDLLSRARSLRDGVTFREE